MISPAKYLTVRIDCFYAVTIIPPCLPVRILIAYGKLFSSPGGVRLPCIALFVILPNAAGRADELFSTTLLVSLAAPRGVVRDAPLVFVLAPLRFLTCSLPTARSVAILK